VPKITDELAYGGAREKIDRLGLRPLYEELRGVITGFTLNVLEVKTRKGANSAAEVRVLFDQAFQRAGDWKGIKSGGIDWSKCRTVNGTRICLGVEVQMSGRSDSGIIMDLHHLKAAITKGLIDVGILVVPNATLAAFLTDRTPQVKDAERHIKVGFDQFPLLVLGIQHDGAGPALPKRPTRPPLAEPKRRTRIVRRAAEPRADYDAGSI
jgi:hypothetical protein